MPKAKMKKFCVLIIREQVEAFLGELVSLCCIELSRAEELPGDSDLYAFVKREIVDLSQHCANKESIAALGTKYTLLFNGWLPPWASEEVLGVFKNYTCAWELGEPTADEIDLAPVELRRPWFFKTYRLAGRKLFSPLMPDANQGIQSTQEDEAGK